MMDSTRNRQSGSFRILIATLLTSFLALAGHAFAAEFTLRVDGMACPFCAYGIEKKLLDTPGIENLKVLMDEGKIVLTLEEHAELNVLALHSAVRKAGFTLHSILVDRATGQLSRDAGGQLVFDSPDPSFRFDVILKDPGALDLIKGVWPLRVLVSGTVTEFDRLEPKLVASEIKENPS